MTNKFFGPNEPASFPQKTLPRSVALCNAATASATASATAMFEDRRVGSTKINSGTQIRRMGLVRVGDRRGRTALCGGQRKALDQSWRRVPGGERARSEWRAITRSKGVQRQHAANDSARRRRRATARSAAGGERRPGR
eukprot:659393-Pleurochrysis_carterae.AAC.2